MATYYETLGLKPTATSEEINTAYRRFAKVYHADAGASDSTLFIAATEAKDVLLDPAMRASYDASLLGTERRQSQTSHQGQRYSPPKATATQPRSTASRAPGYWGKRSWSLLFVAWGLWYVAQRLSSAAAPSGDSKTDLVRTTTSPLQSVRQLVVDLSFLFLIAFLIPWLTRDRVSKAFSFLKHRAFLRKRSPLLLVLVVALGALTIGSFAVIVVVPLAFITWLLIPRARVDAILRKVPGMRAKNPGRKSSDVGARTKTG